MTENKAADSKCYVTRCPHCKRWQGKPSRNFGKDVKNAQCIACRKKFDVIANGRLFDCREAPNIVASRNAPEDNRVGFRRAIYKGGNK